MRDIVEVHEFFVQGRNSLLSHVLLHVSEPSSADKRSKGYFFAVCEVTNGTKEQIEHLQTLIDDIESGYYETDADAGKHPFETTIEYMNRRTHHLLQQNEASIHCCIGVLEDNGALLFVTHGNTFGGLFYEKDGVLEYVDPFDSQDEERDQLFSTVTQGTLSVGQYFIIATPQTGDYFSVDRLQKILPVRNVRQNAVHIQKVLEQFSGKASFGGCLLHIPKKQHIPKTGRQPLGMRGSSAESMKSLIERQRLTEETLAPPLLSYLKKNVDRLKNKDAGQENEENDEHDDSPVRQRTTEYQQAHRKEPRGSRVNTFLTLLGKALVAGGLGIVLIVKHVVLFFWSICKNIFLLISNYRDQRSIVLNNIQDWFQARKNFFARLPLMSKILLIIALVFAVTFFSSIGYIRLSQKKEQARQAYVNTVQAVKDKKDAAEGSLIYNDTTKALELLQEAKGLLISLPQETEEEQKNYADLEAQVETLLANVRRLTPVSSEVLLDLAAISQPTTARRMELIGDRLILFGATDKSYVSFDVVTKETNTRHHDTLTVLTTASTPKEEDTIFFGTQEGGLAGYQPDTDAIVRKDISFPEAKPAITGMAVYNRRLYTLDPSHNQIYRHEPTASGYGKGTAWIEEPVDIANASSISIDGDVFVLTATDIRKLVAGKPELFTVTGLDPVLDNPIKIWTYNDVVNLYVLEPTNNRVIVLSKEGKLLQQYTAPEWQQPEDMIVDEPAGLVYVLDENKLYRFSIK